MPTPNNPTIFVTGATGRLGDLVVRDLLARGARVVAGVRDAAKARPIAELGAAVRSIDYDRPETLAAAFAGIDRLLLISSSEPGVRVRQHEAVIGAARTAGVALIAYTSILHADRSPIGLADDHRATETFLARSGVPHVLLRNGWYTENHLQNIAATCERGVFFGSAGDGKISSAARADYAAAAAVALTSDDQAGRVYELAGDEAFTLTDLAATLAEGSGRPVVYRNLGETEYCAELTARGLPEPMARMLAQCDTATSRGALFDNSRMLKALIGRSTTPLRVSIEQSLAVAAC